MADSNAMVRSFREDLDFAKQAALSTFFGQGRPDVTAAQALMKIEYGREIGVGRMAALTAIHVVEGRPCMSAGLIAARIKSSGKYGFTIAKHTDTECELVFTEGSREVGRSSFSMADAKRADVAFTSRNGKPTSWAKFPRNMLFARALSNGARWFCADIFTGEVYTAEELGAGDVIDVAPATAPPTAPTAEPTAVATAKATEAHHNAIKAELKRLKVTRKTVPTAIGVALGLREPVDPTTLSATQATRVVAFLRGAKRHDVKSVEPDRNTPADEQTIRAVLGQLNRLRIYDERGEHERSFACARALGWEGAPPKDFPQSLTQAEAEKVVAVLKEATAPAEAGDPPPEVTSCTIVAAEIPDGGACPKCGDPADMHLPF